MCEYRNENHYSRQAQQQMTAFFKEELNRSRSLRKHVRRAYYNLRFGHAKISYDWNNAIPLNKSPHLMNKIGYVKSLFPNAHFIFILRDINAQSASQKYLFESIKRLDGRQWFFPENEHGCWSYDHQPNEKRKLQALENFELIPRMWIRLNKLALTELDKINPQRVTKVTYESLVENQQEVMRQVFSQLPLLSKYDNVIPSISRTVIRDKNTSTTGNSLTKWQHQLSKKEKDSLKRVIGDNRSEYNWILDKAQ